VISVQERASYMGQVRDLAKGACKAWMDKNAPDWNSRHPDWRAE
jgi:glycyl-tRNA synthetase alpha chain